MFDEITASSLVKVDLQGNQLSESDYSINPAGFTIHSAIHEVREDAGCVLHLHTPDGTAVASCMEGLLPMNQTAQLVTHDLAYHDYEGIALDHDERPRLQKDLGNKNHMLLRNHGTLTVGPLGRLRLRAHVSPGTSLHDAGAHPHAGADRLSGRTGRDRQECRGCSPTQTDRNCARRRWCGRRFCGNSIASTPATGIEFFSDSV